MGRLAEDAYTALPSDEQSLVPEVFLRCLVPADHGSWSVRPVPAAELFDRPDPAEGEALERVVRAFAPLLTLTGEQVVLARPAVLRAWPRLRDWTENHQQDPAVHHRVRQTAGVWDDNGRRRGDVLTGARLDQALHWITTGHRPSPDRIERGLLDASTRAQTIRTRRTRTIALVLAVTALLSLTATGWAVRAQQTANRQRDAVVSRQLITQSQQSTDPAVSALLAAAAWRLQKGPESRAALINVLTNSFLPAGTIRTPTVSEMAYSPDGRTLATSHDGPTVRLWDVRARRQIGALTGHTSVVSSVAFSSDGRILASGGTDGTVRLWDVGARRPIGEPLTGHTGIVKSVAFSPDGRTLTTGSVDETVRLWDVAMPADLVGSVCAAARRTLTPQEWTQYVPTGPRYRKVCP
ncbi:WD40 repeat domain-containing protein [Spirillospora sp. CA-108201]